MSDTTPTRIPATVITGFLGAGKTSLLRHLLRTAGDRRLALVINEFGELGIDGELLRGCGDAACAEEDIVELANGCICCTVADDFLPTIQKLLARPEPPQHILIETSGLALPKPLVQAFAWPEVRTRVTVDGVIAVVDAPAVAAGRFAEPPTDAGATPLAEHDNPLEELFEDQLQCADLVVVNKTDLLAAADLAAVTAEIGRRTRPAVKLLPAAHGVLDPAVLLGVEAAAEDDLAARPSHHDGEDDHDHDDFASFVVEVAEGASRDVLLRRIAPVIARPDVLRLKGFVAVPGKAMRLVVQAVGTRLDSYFDRDWRAGEPRLTRLVVIGPKSIDQAAIRAALLG